MPKNQQTALIIGASRGLGLGLARAYLDQGWRVIATMRGAASGPLSALSAQSGGALAIETLDVLHDDQIAALRQRLEGQKLDLLFVSAGIGDRRPISDVTAEEFTRMMLTNALAPMRVIEALGALVPLEGTIAAMTSVLGSVGANTTGGYDAYRASKAALNTMLRSYAVRHPDRALVAVHPGWVRTDMGGEEAALTVDESVAGMVAMLANHAGRPGCHYRDYQDEPIVW